MSNVEKKVTMLGLEFSVSGNFTPESPDVWYLSNGEPASFELEDVFLESTDMAEFLQSTYCRSGPQTHLPRIYVTLWDKLEELTEELISSELAEGECDD